jgi:hypothetical protein
LDSGAIGCAASGNPHFPPHLSQSNSRSSRFLQANQSAVDWLVDKVKRATACRQEYRSALIAAVTDKINVRESKRAPEPA